MVSATTHIPVLLREAADALVHNRGGHYVDGTFGRGGHSRAILARLATEGRLTAYDKDPQAVAHAQTTVDDTRFCIRHASFTEMRELPARSVDGVLLDLGVSSPQIDTPQRGFSFRHDGPLDMRMDTTRGQSAADWLATADTQQIAEVIRDYGEERFATPIAKAIVARRQERGALTSTSELAQLVAGAVKTREPGQDPATRTFQAIRIFINAELEELQQALHAALLILKPGGTLAVITFHSLEDRIVKQFMVRHSRETVDRRQPVMAQRSPASMLLQDLHRVRPSAAEVQSNPRARSAILRTAVRSPEAFT
jgi:16S rRNA (cytosine1402-N4)-methyltransferase